MRIFRQTADRIRDNLVQAMGRACRDQTDVMTNIRGTEEEAAAGLKKAD
jgi:hypothetical protein